MVNDSHQHQHQEWVDARMTALADPPDWTPDTASGRQRLQRQRLRQRTTSQMQRRALIGGGLTLAAGGVTLAAVPVARAFAERCVDACIAQTNAWLGTTTLPPSPSAMAPDFTLADVRLSDFRGKVVLLNFWAPWCPPCVVEMPWFDEMQRAHGDRGLVVIGVSVEANAKHKLQYRTVDDDAAGTVAQKYGVETLPATFLIDRNGGIAYRHSGLVSKEVYENEVRQLLLR